MPMEVRLAPVVKVPVLALLPWSLVAMLAGLVVEVVRGEKAHL